jgi:hypothetical protein
MFDRYVVVYGDWVAARREEKIKIEPWQRFYPSKEAAKEMISHFQDGHGTDVLWPRHYHDGDDVAAPPVVWADTPYGGAVGVQFWSKDRYCHWTIVKRELLGFKRLPMTEISYRSEYSGTMIMNMIWAIELSKAPASDKS